MQAEFQTFGEILTHQAASIPDDDAIVLPGQHVSYQELFDRSDAVARSLRGLGAGPGDVVAILMPNCVDFVASFFGIVSIGATCLAINARLRPRELAYILRDSDARICLTSDIVADHVDHAGRLLEAIPDLVELKDNPDAQPAAAPSLAHVVVLGGSRTPGMLDQAEFYRAGADVERDEIRALRKDVATESHAVMLYTSGTTAMPKGCKHSHAAILSSARTVTQRLRIRPGRALWDPCPLFHIAALHPMLAVMAAGGTFISMTYFDPVKALELIERERPPQAWPAYPTILNAILTHPERTEASLSSLEAIVCVGPPDTLRLAEESLPDAKIVNLYGLTESPGGGAMTELDDPAEVRFTTVGKPYNGVEFQIRDPEGKVLQPYTKGSLWIRSQYLIDGYHNDDQKTQEAFDKDGWFDTGDLCDLDDEGRLRYHGRIKDVLKVGGESVSAVELESYLSTHPAVQMCAVVGRPDSKYGEVPVAFVELRPGAEADAAEILNFCREGVAGFKVPREVRFVSEWPMSATKIQKFKLREMARDAEPAPSGAGPG